MGERLAAIMRDPALAAVVGRRGHAYARELQEDLSFPERLEEILEASVTPRRRSPAPRPPSGKPDGQAACDRFALTRMAAAAIGALGQSATDLAKEAGDPPPARELLAALERRIDAGEAGLRSMAAAVATEVAIAAAESEACDPGEAEEPDPLFRLRTARWAIDDADVAQLVALRNPRIRVLAFDTDVAQLLGARTAAELPPQPSLRRSYVVAFADAGAGRDDPLVVDELTARILQLSDGTRTAGAIAATLESKASSNLKWIERLFVHGLISLREAPVAVPPARRPDRRASRGRTPGSPHRRQVVR